MDDFSVYEYHNTLIHKIDTITKMFYVFFAIVTPHIIGTLSSYIGMISISIILLAYSRCLKRALRMFLPLTFVMLTILIVQPLVYRLNEEVIFTICGLNFYKEGLLLAVRICLNLINILFAVCLLTLTTDEAQIVDDLTEAGLSEKIGYVIISVFSIVPIMMRSATTIKNAQESRGLKTKGSFKERMNAFFPLIFPVIISSLTQTKDRAMALEVRHFSSYNVKTKLYTRKYPFFCKVIRFILVFLLIYMILVRLFL